MRNISRPRETKWDTVYLKSSFRHILFIILLLNLPWQAFSQRFSADYWHEGTLILLDNSTLTGKIKYDFQRDIIQFQGKDEEFRPYTAQSFLYFEIDDAYQDRVRRFYSLPYDRDGVGYEAFRLFEVLVEGNINLLAREEQQVSNSNFSYGMYTLPDQEDLVISYYILKKGSRIRSYSGKKGDLLAVMGGYGRNVQQYIKEENLRTGRVNDLVRIISYYNSLTMNK